MKILMQIFIAILLMFRDFRHGFRLDSLLKVVDSLPASHPSVRNTASEEGGFRISRATGIPISLARVSGLVVKMCGFFGF